MRLAVLALALVLSGCFQISSVLSVRPDGSATLTDAVTFSGFGLLAMQEAAEDLDASAFDDRAAALGPGVTVAEVDLRDDGFTVAYAVPDVGALAYTPPSVPGAEGEEMGDAPIRFAFATDPDPTLDIRMPKPTEEPADAGKGAAPPGDPDQQAQALAMMQSMMGDARVTLAVEVEGAITETNAAYAEGPRVTLIDLPMDALFAALADRPDLLAADGPPSPEALADLLDDDSGVRIQRPGTIRVRFR